MQFQIATGHHFEHYIDAIAVLRISIFKEYPYLYDGDMQTEMDYFKSYSASKNSVLIIAEDKEKMIGAAMGMPLAETDKMYLVPFVKNHLSIDSIFYLGDIFLLREYRRKGIGYQMYRIFEDWVRQKKRYQRIAIVEIIRNQNDPRKPKNYSSAHKFWERLGYIEHPEMVMHASYKEIDSVGKISHSLVYSFKDLSKGAPQNL